MSLRRHSIRSQSHPCATSRGDPALMYLKKALRSPKYPSAIPSSSSLRLLQEELQHDVGNLALLVELAEDPSNPRPNRLCFGHLPGEVGGLLLGLSLFTTGPSLTEQPPKTPVDSGYIDRIQSNDIKGKQWPSSCEQGAMLSSTSFHRYEEEANAAQKRCEANLSSR